MRLKPAAFALIVLFPALATAHASEGLSDRQQRIRQALRQDTGEDAAAPARLPPLKCGKNDYSIKESGKRTVVTDADSLKSALKGAKAGDTIVLGAGDYGWMDLNNYQFSNYVAIKGSSGAKVKHIGMKNVKNIQLDGITLEYGSAAGQSSWKPKILEILDSENIRIVNSTIIGNTKGSLAGEDMPDTGIRLAGIKNAVIANSTIGYVGRGAILQSINGLLVEHNVIEGAGYDGFMNQLVHNAVFQSNFFPAGLRNGGSSAHPDYFQFDGGKGRHSAHPGKNIIIRGNVMLQGSNGVNYPCQPGKPCGDVQGVFVAGAPGGDQIYEDISITDNVYCGQGLNGLLVGNGGKNITIKNNAHFSCPRPTDNKMSNIVGVAHDPKINVVISNNATGRVSGDAEAIAKAKAHPGINNCILKGL